MTLHSKPRRIRHPFLASTTSAQKTGMLIWLTEALGDDPYGMSDAFRTDLESMTLCDICGAPCTDLYLHLHPHSFGKQPAIGRLFLPDDQREGFNLASRRETARRASYQRFLRARTRGRHPTEDQIRALLQVQRGRCYFCYVVIQRQGLHLDHYLPLVLGGANDISNRVAACKRCNGRKHDIPGDVFCEIVPPELHPSTQTALLMMRANVAGWRKRGT